RRIEPEAEPKDRRLAAARGADQRRERTGGAVERNAAQRLSHLPAGRKRAADAVEPDTGCHQDQISSSTVVSNMSRVAVMPTAASASMFLAISSSVIEKMPPGASINGFCAVLKNTSFSIERPV